MTPYKLEINASPSWIRVLTVAILLMAELLVIKLIEILSAGRFPTEVEWAYIIALGLLQFITYLLTFLEKTED